jgi:Na+/proline symporter/signal transduction histidine kinase
MNFDIAIVVGFLILNLIAGLYYGRGIRNIKDYALGGRNFSTATIVATIVATWMAGSNIAVTVAETYTKGLWYVIPGLADGISFFIIAYFYAPRMKEFLGNLSVAEAMGDLYGNSARMITSVSAITVSVGNVAVQFSVFVVLLNHFLGISELYSIVVSSFIVITYSTFGGIKSVTFTDMIQFFAFCVVLPMVAFLIWQSLGEPNAVLNVLTKNPLFDFKQFFNYNNPSFLNTLLLFLFFIIPGLDPALFQRISMAKDTAQVARSFSIAGALMILIEYGVIAAIGVFLLASNDTNLNPDSVMTYIMDNYTSGVFKGLFIVGIMAMLMSTADSYINCSSVLFSYDFCQSIGINLNPQKELLLARFSAFTIGIAALLLSLFSHNLLELILSCYSFYMPVVSVPLIFAIFGFRSTSKSVLIGMSAGFITVIIFKILEFDINSLIPGMISNIIFLLCSHYLFGQGGDSDVTKEKINLKISTSNRKNNIRSFNIINFCKSNTPKDEKFFVYFGLLCIISIFSSVSSISFDLYQKHYTTISFVHYSILSIAAAFITYPVLPVFFKKENYISIIWNIAIAYCLAFCSSLLFIISNFDQNLLTTLMVNLLILSILLRWQVALFMIVVSLFCSIEFYKLFYDTNFMVSNISAHFKIVYLLAVVASVVIAFLKPKQEYVEATEHKVDKLEITVDHLNGEITELDEKVGHYSQRVADQAMEIERLGATAQKILNNVNHELRLPVGNVMNFAEMLSEGLGKYNDNQLKDLSDEVFKNSNRLSTMILNMLDLAMLDVKKIELNKKTINLSELVEDRVDNCRKIYLQGKKIDFELKIEPNVLASVDANYIRQTVDNLIINAITYSQSGTIKVSVLRKSKNIVELIIKDEGIGIPKSELFDIFNPFKMGIHTQSKAEGRGIGLALCKSAVEAHGGDINVVSENAKGAVFKVVLPI